MSKIETKHSLKSNWNYDQIDFETGVHLSPSSLASINLMPAMTTQFCRRHLRNCSQCGKHLNQNAKNRVSINIKI